MENVKLFLREYPYCLLTEYFIRSYHITPEMQYEICSIPARALLKAQRFDLMAKWIYIDAKEKGIDMEDAHNLYVDHIRAFTLGQFVEPGNETKNTAQKYIDTFDKLITEFRSHEFDLEVSLIPVGEGDVLLDGAHRCACAAYYNKNVTIIRFPQIQRSFDYRFFEERELADMWMDRMALEYCHVREGVYFACFWPVAYEKGLYEQALALLREKCGDIVYENEIDLNYNGLYNLMIQVYAHQEWTGSYENHHQGVKKKADSCYAKKPMRIVVFESSSLDAVVCTKGAIRDIFGLENHAIHISDSDLETRLMADILLNSHSRHFLKFGHPDNCTNFNHLFAEYRKQVMDYQKADCYIIDSSSILAVYGARECRDLDFLTVDPDWTSLFAACEKIDNHEGQLRHYSFSVKDMLHNPQNYFVYQGMKFLSLSVLRQMKHQRNEKKDRVDIKLIDKLQRGKEISRKQKIRSQQKKKVSREKVILQWKIRRKMVIESILQRRVYGIILLGCMYPVAIILKKKEKWKAYRDTWKSTI